MIFVSTSIFVHNLIALFKLGQGLEFLIVSLLFVGWFYALCFQLYARERKYNVKKDILIR